MKYAIVYSSKTGNTAELAMVVKETMGEEDCVYEGGPESAGNPNAPLVFVGFWTDKGSCSEDMSQWLDGLRGKQVFLFGTAGFGGSEEYFDTILKRVGEKLDNSNTRIGAFMCQGRMQDTVLKRYETMMKQDPQNMRLEGMIANYHQASAHPDRDDKLRLREYIQKNVELL